MKNKIVTLFGRAEPDELVKLKELIRHNGGMMPSQNEMLDVLHRSNKSRTERAAMSRQVTKGEVSLDLEFFYNPDTKTYTIKYVRNKKNIDAADLTDEEVKAAVLVCDKQLLDCNREEGLNEEIDVLRSRLKNHSKEYEDLLLELEIRGLEVQ